MNAALLEPAEPGFTGNWKESKWSWAKMEQIFPLFSGVI